MSQLYNPYIGQVPGQQPATPQTWLPGNQTMGITPEEATKQAANFFNIPH